MTEVMWHSSLCSSQWSFLWHCVAPRLHPVSNPLMRIHQGRSHRWRKFSRVQGCIRTLQSPAQVTGTTNGPISQEFTQRNTNSEGGEFVFINGGTKASDQILVIRIDQTATSGLPVNTQTVLSPRISEHSIFKHTTNFFPVFFYFLDAKEKERTFFWLECSSLFPGILSPWAGQASSHQDYIRKASVQWCSLFMYSCHNFLLQCGWETVFQVWENGLSKRKKSIWIKVKQNRFPERTFRLTSTCAMTTLRQEDTAHRWQPYSYWDLWRQPSSSCSLAESSPMLCM